MTWEIRKVEYDSRSSYNNNNPFCEITVICWDLRDARRILALLQMEQKKHHDRPAKKEKGS